MAFSLAHTLKRLREPEESESIQNSSESNFNNVSLNEDDKTEVCSSASKALDDIISILCQSDTDIKTSVENAQIQENETSVGQSDTITNNENEYFNNDTCSSVEIVEENNVSQQIFDFSHIPIQVTGAWSDFENTSMNNYTRGCKWAPDGSCILTCSDDNNLKIFNLPVELWDSSKWSDIPEMTSVLKVSEGEIVYDFSWYPLMNSTDPCTCCFASCSKNSSVHLWDAFSGDLRCSYRSYDNMDEITAPRSLSFDADGSKLYCGFEKIIRVFNINLPGRNYEERRTFDKKSGQSGIISCFAFSSANRSISAAGSYQKTIGIYSEPDGTLECVLEGHRGGITHMQFSPDGNLLYSGGRKDPDILCWDIRNLGEVLYSMRRSCLTNQRMYFDVSRDGRYVISGNTNGVISIWDTTKEPKEVSLDDFNILEPVQFFLSHNDCVNGISIHPSYPLLCSSSGQRKFPSLLSDNEDEIFSAKSEKSDNSLRLWWIGGGS